MNEHTICYFCSISIHFRFHKNRVGIQFFLSFILFRIRTGDAKSGTKPLKVETNELRCYEGFRQTLEFH